jgi:hypothetical protein
MVVHVRYYNNLVRFLVPLTYLERIYYRYRYRYCLDMVANHSVPVPLGLPRNKPFGTTTDSATFIFHVYTFSKLLID